MNIPLLLIERQLIEPLVMAQRKHQAQINAYLAITAARAGEDGTAYALDCDNWQLVPVDTKEQVDEKLSQLATKEDVALAGLKES